MADVDYVAIGVCVANKLVGTKALKAMQSQKAIVAVDLKGVVTADVNEDILNILQAEFENIKWHPR